MDGAQRQYSLKAYEINVATNTSLVERVFGVVLVSTLALFIGGGVYLRTVRVLEARDEQRMVAVRTRMVIEEKKAPVPEKPKPAPKKEVVDLTAKPLMARKEEVKTEEPKPKERPVYGLRRVFATGFGAGGALSDAVIGKLGNTIDKDVDTLTATKGEIKGVVASVTTITQAPRLRTQVKPEYTKEMLENRIEGVIRAEILVDIDGAVKEVKVLNDLGFGSAESVRQAALKLLFDPARRGEELVATRITISFRFVLPQG